MPNPNDPAGLPPTAGPGQFDDEDEVTRVAEPREQAELTLPAARQSARPPPQSSPPGAQPTSTRPPPPRSPLPRPRSSSVLKMALAGVAGLLTVMLAAALTILLSSRGGELVVNVSGTAGESIEGLSVFIDGERRCTQTPCKVDGLSPGAHGVKADGHGYGRTVERHVVVEAGRQALLELVLPPDPGTGVRVTAKVQGLRLFVDGRELGSLPREVGNLSPGEHTFRVEGSPAFAAFERKVLVPAGQMVELELSPPVVEGKLRVEAGRNAAGAEVLLETGGERRKLSSLPIELTVRADEKPKLTAAKPGFDEFSRLIEFRPGEPELTVTIELTEAAEEEPTAEEPPAPKASAARRTASVWKPRAGTGAAKPAKPAKPAATPDESSSEPAALNVDPYKNTGKVSVNSIPPSNVTLNGRDVGSTPKMGIDMPVGPVTAVFTHPQLGTMTRSGVVKAGGSITLVVKFKQPE